MDVFDTPARQDVTFGGVGAGLGGLASKALPFIKNIHNPIARVATGILGGTLLGTGVSKGINALNPPPNGPSVGDLHTPREFRLNPTESPTHASSEPFSLMNALSKGQRNMDSTPGNDDSVPPLHQRFNEGQERINTLNSKMKELGNVRRGISSSGGLNDQLHYRDLTNQASGLQGQKDAILGSLNEERNHALGEQARARRSLSGALADTNDAIHYREGDAARMAQRMRETADDQSPMGYVRRAWEGLTGFNGRAERLNSELESNRNAQSYLQNQYAPALDNYVPNLPY